MAYSYENVVVLGRVDQFATTEHLPIGLLSSTDGHTGAHWVVRTSAHNGNAGEDATYITPAPFLGQIEALRPLTEAQFRQQGARQTTCRTCSAGIWLMSSSCRLCRSRICSRRTSSCHVMAPPPPGHPTQAQILLCRGCNELCKQSGREQQLQRKRDYEAWRRTDVTQQLQTMDLCIATHDSQAVKEQGMHHRREWYVRHSPVADNSFEGFRTPQTTDRSSIQLSPDFFGEQSSMSSSMISPSSSVLSNSIQPPQPSQSPALVNAASPPQVPGTMEVDTNVAEPVVSNDQPSSGPASGCSLMPNAPLHSSAAALWGSQPIASENLEAGSDGSEMQDDAEELPANEQYRQIVDGAISNMVDKLTTKILKDYAGVRWTGDEVKPKRVVLIIMQTMCGKGSLKQHPEADRIIREMINKAEVQPGSARIGEVIDGVKAVLTDVFNVADLFAQCDLSNIGEHITHRRNALDAFCTRGPDSTRCFFIGTLLSGNANALTNFLFGNSG